ncbi:DUF1513 domain-containing protein [Tateyamaria omphalii]|uniref:Twin-arginine translocation pathway signal n=1 Tax=Tateyamaria omphalii TaxID=299262 RepID=A0A1P8N1M7_9RHOB|nr:DUF1513 domain-containing protein [Tateyamaria omphalii]APX14089.1 hypothetical protein BWR18_19690 [Tateyamaria omphalii]
MPSRRAFLAGLTSASLTPTLGWADVGNPVALSAAMHPSGRYALVGLTGAGDITFQLPLPARGHAAAAHPHIAEAVAIARRPGTFAKVIDCGTGDVKQTLISPKGRHFYGHAAFSSDGILLFTPENDIATGAGRIGVWDRSAGYKRVGDVPSGGIGPHEILRLPNGTLAVANGGIRTHPDTGRDKLNLDTMRPNLTILAPDGPHIDTAHVPDHTHQNSLRHIAAGPDGTVICGFQWQGDPFDAPPLVALYKGNGTLLPADMDDAALYGLDGYIGSVSAFGQGHYAASSPRGNMAFTFDQSGQQTGAHKATDVCGLCAAPGGTCLVTDGLGRVHSLADTRLTLLKTHPLAFDNHLVALTG